MNTTRLSPQEKLARLGRVTKAKSKIPRGATRVMMRHYFPEDMKDKTFRGRLRNVLDLKSTDIDMIEKLEFIAESYGNPVEQ